MKKVFIFILMMFVTPCFAAKKTPTSKPAKKRQASSKITKQKEVKIPLYKIDSSLLDAPPADSALAKILKTQVIRVCLRSDIPPFGYFSNGRLIGFDVSLSRMLVMTLSTYYKKNIMVALSVLQAKDRINSILNHHCDLVIAAFSKTKERAQKIAFSRVYAQTDKVLIAKEKPALKPVIALVKGTTAKAPELKATIRYFQNYNEIIVGMEAGEVDYIVADRPIAQHMIRSVSRSYRIIKVMPELELYSIGLHKTKKHLLKAVNRALSDIARTGHLMYLQRQWL